MYWAPTVFMCSGQSWEYNNGKTDPCLQEVAILQQGVCVCAKSLELCLTLYDPMDHSLPGTSVCEIFQARILEWVAMQALLLGIFLIQGLTSHSLMPLHWQAGFLALAPPGKPAHLGDRSIRQQQQQHNKMQHDKDSINDLIYWCLK